MPHYMKQTMLRNMLKLLILRNMLKLYYTKI